MLFYMWNIALSQQAHEIKVAPLEFLLPFVLYVYYETMKKYTGRLWNTRLKWKDACRCWLQSRGAPVCPAAGWRGPNCALYLVTTQATTRQYSAESDGSRREQTGGEGWRWRGRVLVVGGSGHDWHQAVAVWPSLPGPGTIPSSHRGHGHTRTTTDFTICGGVAFSLSH